MDEQLKMGADKFFSERHSSILMKFRSEDRKNAEFLEKLSQMESMIRNLVTDETWLKISSYIDLMSIHNNIQSKYLYGQGIKDCVILSHFLDSDFTRACFVNISDCGI